MWIFVFAIVQLVCSMPLSSVRQFHEVEAGFESVFLTDLQNKIINATSSPTLKAQIKNCMLNTLETTVKYNSTSAFIITGDINAMWLRDSMNQLHPFVEFVNNDTKIDWLVRKIIIRQGQFIRSDPYANAFQDGVQMNVEHRGDNSRRLLFGVPFEAIFNHSVVFERKFEIDSLAAFLRLSNEYFLARNNSDFVDVKWIETYELILKVVNLMRRSFAEENRDGDPAYTFSRVTSQPTDSLSHERGVPVGSCGLIRSAFRPSDDSTTFQYFIPGNCMMQAELNRSIALLKNVSISGYETRVKALLDKVSTISQELHDAIYKYGITEHEGKQIFAYEVDCYGNQLKMDDANSPSLLALPYLGFIDAKDPLYVNTRNFVWSEKNPWFFKGTKGQGIGGPHVGLDYIWPMSLIMKALTSNDKKQIEECLKIISSTTAGTNFMHESFYKDDDRRYSRSWFAWANTLFGHLIIRIYREFPEILANFS